MKIIKKLNPIQESISKVGETKKSLKEEIDKNYKIGRVLDPAAADAVDLHREFRKQGLERQANPDKDPLVKEFIDETASAKSRTKHIDVVDRKELAKVLTEAKKKKQKFKVGKSDKLGYRYFVDIFPVYGSQGALDVVEDDDTEVEVAETDSGEMLSESMNKPLSFEEAKKLIKDKFGTDLNKETYDAILKLGGSKNTKNNLKEDIESDIKSYISWCKKNNREAKDYNSLKDFMSNKKNLKESYSSDKEEDVLELARALGTAHDGLIEAQDLLDDLVGREIISSDLYDEIMDLESDVSKYDFMGEDDPVQVLLDKYGYNDDLNESLKEAKYKIPMNDSEDYINAMYKAYKALKNRKSGYAAVYGYRKDKKFIPLLSIKDSQAELTKVVDGLKTREKGQTDTIVYTLFKNNLDGAEDTLKSKGLLKENLQDYDPDEEFAAELVKAGATVDDLKAGK